MRTIPALLLVLLTTPALAETFAETCKRFSGFDANDDGHVEIEALTPLPTPLPTPAGDGQLVLVLVEDRLLEDLGADLDLRAALDTHAADLLADGFRPRLVSARLSRGARHQDGRTLLALRAFLQKVRTHDPSLAGVVLVGAFPDALLVRTCNWKKNNPLTINKGKANEKSFKEKVTHLATRPEPVADRADIVLADLNGSWEERYVEARAALPSHIGIFPAGVPDAGGVAADYERTTRAFQDFFLVDDGKLEVEVVDEGLRMTPRWDATDDECTASDRERPNPLAQPEVSVSRINARGIALSPKASLRDVEGRGLLDDDGVPQRLRFASAKQVPKWSGVWEHDPRLERRLLREYFLRNHRFRRGYVAHTSFRPASASRGLGSGQRVVRRGHGSWRGFAAPGYDAHQATLVDLVAWLQRPAALRTLRAHSDAYGSVFGPTKIAELHAAIGGAPWSWSRVGSDLVPSLQAACRGGKADFFLYRTLWANGIRPAPSLVIHTGCHGISPPGARRHPWDHPAYDRAQGAEAFLFYAGGLALVGRAKVFYDEPRGFSRVLARGKTFGEAWMEYYEVESRGPTFGEVGGRIGRKRAYFWSVLGDWTLRLREPPRWR